jgi:CubicO group peptidase (beta-lactamase class C family)
MQLVERGSISLDQPVTRSIENFRLADSAGSGITMRELLSHRSGMSDRTFREKSIVPVPRSLSEAVTSLQTARLATPPGERRSYHNPNYWVAARVVEAVSGQSFEGYLREKILLPLGMTKTSTVSSMDEAPDVAVGSIRILGHPIARKEPAWFLNGCCGVVTTAEDMARWLIFQNTNQQRLVSAEDLQAMHDGLGWSSEPEDGQRVYTHNGVMFTFSARQYVLPDVGDGVGIAVITNTGLALAPLDSDAVGEMLKALAEGKQVEQPLRYGLIADLVLVGLILATILRIFWKGTRWPASRSRARSMLAIAVGLLPIAWLLLYPASLRLLSARDVNWEQSLTSAPLLFVWVAVLAVNGLLSVASGFRSARRFT